MLPHGSRNHTGDGHRVSSCSCDQPPLTGTPGPLHTLARGCTSFILLAQRGRAKAPWSVRDQGSKAIANSEVRPPGNVKRGARDGKGTARSSLPHGARRRLSPAAGTWPCRRSSAQPGPNEALPLRRCVQSHLRAPRPAQRPRGEHRACPCPVSLRLGGE